MLVDREHAHKTLDSIYRYNYKRRLDQHESVQRVYALNDEAALVICDYGKAKRPAVPFPYFAEIMTGFEYSAAILMMFEGMTDRGVELIGNIRRRYDGERRNPWDEAECGHHYARAMASWSAIPALSGFSYDARTQVVTAMPRIRSAQFKSFWSNGTGWGTFTQKPNEFTIAVDAGHLACRNLRLAWLSAGSVSVSVAGQNIAATTSIDDGQFTVKLSRGVELREGDHLLVKRRV